jgi:hypothetical protein
MCAHIHCDLKPVDFHACASSCKSDEHIRTSCLLAEPHRIEGTIPADVTDDARRRGRHFRAEWDAFEPFLRQRISFDVNLHWRVDH